MHFDDETMQVRIVDTAGWERLEMWDEEDARRRSLNKRMMSDMIKQTRQALIYSDVAIFMIDT